MSDLPVILLAFANDLEGKRYLRDLPKELHELTAVLESPQSRRLCLLRVVPNATLATIQAQFDEYGQRIKLFHYAGHAGPEGLHLESEDGAKVAFAAGLADYLGRKGVQLVFLNGCSTGPQALGLHTAGVDAVIATSRSINDKAARNFAVRFYCELVNGHPFADAFALASASVRTASGKKPTALIERGGPTRQIGTEDITDDDGYCWRIFIRKGAEAVESITLPELAGDPLLGLPALPPPERLEPMPYRYLQPYTEDYAHVFFGRGQAIADLYNRVVSTDPRRLIFYSGPTGVGKSSVLHAGLLPRLKASHEVRYARRDATLGLLGTMCRSLGLPSESASPDELARAWLACDTQEKPLVVILDQAEEAFTRPNNASVSPQAEVDALVAVMKGLFEGPARGTKGRVMLGFRKEWLQEFERSCDTQRLGYDSVKLAPLDHAGVVEAIEGPAMSPNEAVRNYYDLHVEDGLAETIAAHLMTDAGSALAPTLQVLLSKMWETAGGKGARFTEWLYVTMRLKGILLDDILRQGLEHLAESQPSAAKSGFGLDLLEFHTTELGTAESRSIKSLEARYPHRPDLKGTIEALKSSYLLVDSEPSKSADPFVPVADTSNRTRLCHDTLAPLVQKAFRDSQLPGPRAHRLLKARTQGWKDGKTGETLTENQLKLVEEGLPATGTIYGDPKAPTETSPEARCVSASRIEVMQAKEREQKRSQLIKGLQYTAAVASVCALFFAVYSQRQKAEAEKQTSIAVEKTKVANEKTAEAQKEKAEALKQANLAQQRERIALARQLTAYSKEFQMVLPIRASLLATEAIRSTLDLGYANVKSSEGSLYLSLQDFGGKLIGEHEKAISCLRLTPDGKLVTGSFDGTARIWDMKEPTKEPVVLRGHEGQIGCLLISPDGRLVTGSNDNTVRIWDMKEPNKKPIILIGYQGLINCLAISPDGKLVTGSGDNTARIWDMRELIKEPIILRGHGGWINCLDFTTDGRLITGSGDNTARIWDLKESKKNLLVFRGHEKRIGCLVFASDGRLVTGSDDNTARIWDLDKPNKEPVVLRGHEGPIWCLAISPDGRLVTGSLDKTARIWDLNERNNKPIVLKGHGNWITCLDFTSDGRLVTGSDDNTIRIWDLKHPSKQPDVLHGHQEPILCIGFAPDGRLVSGSGDKNARIWDLKEPTKQPVVLRGHNGPISCLAFAPDGQLVTGSGDNSARIWDLKEPTKQPVVLRGHIGPISCLVFAPDGRLVTGSDDNSLRIWNLKQPTVEPVGLFGNQGPISCLDFSPDGRLVSGSLDNTARIWELDIGKLLKTAAEVCGRNMTADEWQQFLPDYKYHRTFPDLPEGSGVAEAVKAGTLLRASSDTGPLERVDEPAGNSRR